LLTAVLDNQQPETGNNSTEVLKAVVDSLRLTLSLDAVCGTGLLRIPEDIRGQVFYLVVDKPSHEI